MKISPMASSGATIGAISTGGAVTPQMRSLKMNTNATPGRIVDGDPTADPPAPTNQTPLPNPDPKDGQPDATNQPLSPQAAALARERRSLQRQQREFDQKVRAYEEKQASTQGTLFSKEQILGNPLGVLLENGVTYDQLTQAVLASQNGQTPELIRLQNKIKELEAGVDKKLEDRDTQAEQQTLSEMRHECRRLLQTDAEGRYEMVKGDPSGERYAMDLIRREWKENGRVIMPDEALAEVDRYLFEIAVKQAQSKRVQAKLSPQSGSDAQQPQRDGMRTLSNRDTARPVMDRRQRALMAFRGELNK
jgi:hypothetical protein